MTFKEVSFQLGPRVVFDSAFSPLFSLTARRFPSPHLIHISNSSSLVCKGNGIVIHSLTLHGALEVSVAPGVALEILELEVRNAGIRFVELGDEGVSDEIAIRGYQVERLEVMEVVVDVAGDYVMRGTKEGKVTLTARGNDQQVLHEHVVGASGVRVPSGCDPK